MASVRLLPSGKWQASVLLDQGRRTTSTHLTAGEAQTWADDAEAERDRMRLAARERQNKPRGDILLYELEDLVVHDGLTAAQKRKLARLADLSRRG